MRTWTRWTALLWATLGAGCAGSLEIWDPPSTETETSFAPSGVSSERRPGLTSSGDRAPEPLGRVTCAIPPQWSYPHLLEEGATVTSSYDGQRLCLGAEAQGQHLCHWTKLFDRRTRAVQACYELALQAAEQQGLRAVRGAADQWKELREQMLPPDWQPGASEGSRSSFSHWVALMANGGRPMAASSEPLCFLTKAEDGPAVQTESIVSSLRWAWQAQLAEEKRVLDLLQQGLRVELPEQATSLEVRVELQEEELLAPPATDKRCVFLPLAD
ncbi:MAG: hypothetical protein IT371_13750 [Deltaproteobacteria bacterium]|nr:hypothetical protein [Deltaproteobacteria bacterium]